MGESADMMDRQQEINDLKTVLSTRAGRRYLWRLLGQAGVFRLSFVAGAPDATAFNEGARNLGRSVMAEIMDEAPNSFLAMQKEAIDDEQRRREEEALAKAGRSDTDD
jgi:hypothetical protein